MKHDTFPSVWMTRELVKKAFSVRHKCTSSYEIYHNFISHASRETHGRLGILS